MAKWADFAITAVRYDIRREHIVSLEVRQDLGDKLGTPASHPRQVVVDAIERGLQSFITAVLRQGNWQMGARVEVVVINGIRYLKTVRDGIRADNLGELPEF